MCNNYLYLFILACKIIKNTLLVMPASVCSTATYHQVSSQSSKWVATPAGGRSGELLRWEMRNLSTAVMIRIDHWHVSQTDVLHRGDSTFPRSTSDIRKTAGQTENLLCSTRGCRMNLWSNTAVFKWNVFCFLFFLSDLDALTDLSDSRKVFWVKSAFRWKWNPEQTFWSRTKQSVDTQKAWIE